MWGIEYLATQCREGIAPQVRTSIQGEILGRQDTFLYYTSLPCKHVSARIEPVLHGAILPDLGQARRAQSECISPTTSAACSDTSACLHIQSTLQCLGSLPLSFLLPLSLPLIHRTLSGAIGGHPPRGYPWIHSMCIMHDHPSPQGAPQGAGLCVLIRPCLCPAAASHMRSAMHASCQPQTTTRKLRRASLDRILSGPHKPQCTITSETLSSRIVSKCMRVHACADLTRPSRLPLSSLWLWHGSLPARPSSAAPQGCLALRSTWPCMHVRHAQVSATHLRYCTLLPLESRKVDNRLVNKNCVCICGIVRHASVSSGAGKAASMGCFHEAADDSSSHQTLSHKTT